MQEVGTIEWKLALYPGQFGFQTVNLRFSYRTANAPIGDARRNWIWAGASYLWDSSKPASQIEKEIQNVCRAKIGAPPIP
jgi:hypothetical protein